MIHLTRINRCPLVVNSDLIEHIEVTPDTVITLINGQKFVVLESSEDVVEKVRDFRRSLSVQVNRFLAIPNEESPEDIRS